MTNTVNRYYVDCIGHRWATAAVPHPTIERAREHARRSSLDSFEARVWDCGESPRGTLVAKYVRGEEVAS